MLGGEPVGDHSPTTKRRRTGIRTIYAAGKNSIRKALIYLRDGKKFAGEFFTQPLRN